MITQPVPAPGQTAAADAGPVLPALVVGAGEHTAVRFLEFFTVRIRNPNTRRAYGRAAADFLAWCEDASVLSITGVQPSHVATWVERQCREYAVPTAKLRLPPSATSLIG